VQSSSISASFNKTPIGAGRTIWFNGVLKASGVGRSGATVRFDQSTIQFTANSVNYTLAVPNGVVTFSPAATTATTVFDGATNTWYTTVPVKLGGNMFLHGLGFPVPVNFPGGVGPVTWSGRFAVDKPGVSVSWNWAAAVYTSFSTDNNALGVKPVDDAKTSVYKNADHAGTPENFKTFVTGGARGGGGANYTGGLANSQNVCTAH
jgi:hypothetical protein